MRSKDPVKRVIMLTLGWEDLPKSWSIYDTDPLVRIVEPVPALLVETVDGWVLIDTGFNKALIEDIALRRRFHGDFYEIRPILPAYDKDPLLDALDRFGLGVDDLLCVAVSHLHNDHAGGLRHFGASGTPVYIQKRELEFGMFDSVRAEGHGFCRVDFDDPKLNWKLIDGDAEIAPGIGAVLTAGHTPGHQSFVVTGSQDRDEQGYVFAFDAGDLVENFDSELAIGGYIDVEPNDTLEPIRRLKSIAAEHGYKLIPGHDPRVWPTELERRYREIL